MLKKMNKLYFTLTLSATVFLTYLIRYKNFLQWQSIVNFQGDSLDDPDFYLNPKYSICPSHDESYLFITFVIISPHQFERRMEIRNTWANKNSSTDFRIIFSVGFSKDQTINDQIKDEFNAYKDILQFSNFIDSYRNCTYKVMKTYKWIDEYCSNSKYIMKICDDVQVNTLGLLGHFKNMTYKTNHLFGYTIGGVGPIRQPTNKWYVSEKEYPAGYYPVYVQGSVYILTSDVASRYHQDFIKNPQPPFTTWLDDVYMGILAVKFNTTIIDSRSHFKLDPNRKIILTKEFWFQILGAMK
jgi:hypothetical protein